MVLNAFNMDKHLTPEEYQDNLDPYQEHLQALAHELYVKKRCLVVVFEGWDAAGKGGAIKAPDRKA